MQRCFTNILCEDVEAAARFYEEMLGCHRLGEFGFFILMGHAERIGFELGLLQLTHETVPEALRNERGGAILTFVVEDVQPYYDKALVMGLEIVEPPRDLVYGQRRLLVRDVTGTMIDISAPIR